KTILSLRHKAIPASLHFKEPNPKIPWSELPLVMQTKLASWPEGPGPAVAAVNSFGITGTTAHIVVAEWTESGLKESSEVVDQDYPLVLSAPSREVLRGLAKSYVNFLQQE